MSEREAIWDAVHEERRRLARDLEALSDEQWRAPSLCRGWSVHDVLAHLVDSATTTRLGFVRQMAAARFSFDRANDLGMERHRAAGARDTLRAFRAVTDRTDTPPGPLASRLVEAYVHGEDIRRPLGMRARYPTAPVMTALRYLARTGATFGGGRERVRGTCLSPVETDQRIGSGPVARGSAVALLLAAAGRPVRPGELSGEGARILAARTWTGPGRG